MKTNYRPRSSAPNRKRTTLIVLVIAVFVLVVSFLRGPLMMIAVPMWKSAASVSQGMNDFFAIFSSKISLSNENEALKERLASYDSLLSASRAETDSREELLNAFGRTSSTTGIAAAVLVHPPESPYDMLILDAGTKENVHLQDKVRTPEGSLLGTITEVFDHTSKVTLYTSSGLKTNAVLERNSLPVVLSGRGGGNFDFDLPRSLEVSVEDKILSPSITGEMLGVVKDVSAAATDSFQHVLVESVGNIYTLRFVLITP